METQTRTVYSVSCFDRTVPPLESYRQTAYTDRQDAIDWLALKAETGHERLRMKTTTTTEEEFDPEDFLTS